MTDLISRQAAIDAILHNQEVYSNNFGDDPIDKYTVAVIDIDAQTIAQLPSVEKHGKWIGVSPMVDTEECSLCGFQIQSSELATPYCPWCGARLDGEQWIAQ